MRRVEVSPYQVRWVSTFEEEADRLRQTFGDEVVDIHHIGSTSVPGLKAKPIVDILTIVKAIHRVDLYNDAMITLGYHPKGENGVIGRRYFEKGGDQRTHHLHVYQEGSPDIERHLAFRAYLCAHPADAKRYSDLKEELARQFPFDIESYIRGKEDLVLEIERKAMRRP